MVVSVPRPGAAAVLGHDGDDGDEGDGHESSKYDSGGVFLMRVITRNAAVNGRGTLQQPRRCAPPTGHVSDGDGVPTNHGTRAGQRPDSDERRDRPPGDWTRTAGVEYYGARLGATGTGNAEFACRLRPATTVAPAGGGLLSYAVRFPSTTSEAVTTSTFAWSTYSRTERKSSSGMASGPIAWWLTTSIWPKRSA